MDDFGLVLTGTLRNVSERSYKTDDGERHTVPVVIVDTGRDYMDQVSVRAEESRLLDALRERKGQIVELDVTVGNFQRLWLVGIR